MHTPDTSSLPMSSSVPPTMFPSAFRLTGKDGVAQDRAPARTLSEVSKALHSVPGLDPDHCKRMEAAVRTAARLLGCSTDALPATPKELLPMLAALSSAGTGRSQKTLANTRSLVKEALRLVGAGRRVRFDRTPLSPAWQILYDALPSKQLRNGMSRFLHYASHGGIEPDTVDQCLLDRFIADLEQAGEVANVPRRHRDIAVFWNRCRREIAGWPHCKLVEPVTARVQKNRKWAEFEQPFRAAVDHYCDWLTGSDLFANDGPPKTYRATTITHRRELIRIAGSSLMESGFPAAKLLSLDDLVVPDNAKELLRVLHRRAGGNKTAFVRSLATELVFLASKYRRASQPTIDALKDLRRKLGAPPPGLTEKNQSLLALLDDEDLLNKLVALPSQLAARARGTRMSPGRRSQQMQIALAIELLLCAPLRLANLEALELDKHLPRHIKPGRETLLSFVAEEMKNDRPMTFSLSIPATHLLHEYLRAFRPLLATPGQDALFVGPDGGARKAGTLRDAITKAIKRRLDIHMTPHQFRHLAGYLVLRDNPSNYAVVQQLLGHANLKTTTNFYLAGQSRAAGHVLDEILSKRRQPSRVR